MKRLFQLFLLTCAAQILTAAQSFSQTVESTQTFGDWQVTCPDGQTCRMSQVIVQPSSSRLILQVMIAKGDTPTALLTFPLGILLSTGWQYQIDSKRPEIQPFEICNHEGCHAGWKLPDRLLSALKAGNDLSIKFLDAGKTEVNPVISLAGFTKAYEALK